MHLDGVASLGLALALDGGSDVNLQVSGEDTDSSRSHKGKSEEEALHFVWLVRPVN